MGDSSNGGGREGRVGKGKGGKGRRERGGEGEGKSLTYDDRILDMPLTVLYLLLVILKNCQPRYQRQMLSPIFVCKKVQIDLGSGLYVCNNFYIFEKNVSWKNQEVSQIKCSPLPGSQ